jgi:hypothetical protein
VTLEHLARHLRIARLVGAEQPNPLETGEEQESTKRNECQQIGGAAGALGQRTLGIQIGLGQRDDYCTLSGRR